MKWVVFVFLMSMPRAHLVLAQTALVVPQQTEVVIQGNSNVSSFECRARKVAGSGRIAGEAESITTAEAYVDVDVRSFDCGNVRMNGDLIEALKAEVHPSIAYRLERVDLVEEHPSGQYDMEVVGTISVAGVARQVQTRVIADRLPNGYYTAQGAVDLAMSDFDIAPPTALFGLVRVRDRITVRFDIQAVPDAAETDHARSSLIERTPTVNRPE